MSPIRSQKKKRKVEKRKKKKKMEPKRMKMAAASGSSEESSADWFDAFGKKIASNLNASPTRSLDTFESVFNMSRRTFEYICSLARGHMMVKHFAFSNGTPMSIYDQVALALRRLSSGNSLVSIGDSFGAHHSTVFQVTWRFVEAIEMKRLQHIGWPSTENELADIKSKFEQIVRLPNCCGAIDATHIILLLSTSEKGADVWVDAKGSHSMPLQAIVGPNLKFLDVVTGFPGKLTEGKLLQQSGFYHKCITGERLNGEKVKLSEEAELQEYIVGDSAYPLLPWLLTPYQGNELSQTKADFNERLFAAHNVARRALARLKDVWKIINGVMWRPDKHKLPRYILVCCILHNIMIDMEDEVMAEYPLSHQHDPGYEEDVCDFADESAWVLRDKLAEYLSGKMHP
ncbi:hypothetical protein ACH5RR_010022 [Cinchona calisaya]|uniref:DDE Tnp4 domain-containing protein n=1 Tax=Cinchona calisaya TaxID=153742 RepID=A0ABD3AIB1_9GENT